MAINYTALKSELLTDPLAVGYAASIASGADLTSANLINSPGPTAAYDLFRADISLGDIVSNMAAADFTALTDSQVARLTLLLLAGRLDVRDANSRAILNGLFGSLSAGTKAAIAAAIKKRGSRCEVLFGIGTAVTYQDVAIALRST